MLIFLYGQDSYRMQKKLDEIIESYKKIHKSGLSFKCFGEEKFDLDEIINSLQTVSMFEEKKLFVLKNILSLSDDERLLDLLKRINNSKNINLVIYENNKIKAADPLIKFLKSKAKSQEFTLLGGENLKNWVKKRFSDYEANITPAAAEKIVNFVGNDLWQMENEINKLANYKLGGTVGEKDIDFLIKPKIESDIFKTIDAIAQKNKKKALILLRGHIGKGDSPLYLFSMINYQFRNLLIIKDLVERNNPYYIILKKANLHPFVVKKSYEQAQKFSFLELKKIYQKIFQADLNIKTGKIDPQTALDLLIAAI